MSKFKVKPEHITLLKAIATNGDMDYGTFDVARDAAGALGIGIGDGSLTVRQAVQAETLHAELNEALEIILAHWEKTNE